TAVPLLPDGEQSKAVLPLRCLNISYRYICCPALPSSPSMDSSLLFHICLRSSLRISPRFCHLILLRTSSERWQRLSQWPRWPDRSNESPALRLFSREMISGIPVPMPGLLFFVPGDVLS